MPGLDENKTIIINGEEGIITGVIGDGSCFLHSVVTDISFDSFTRLSREKRGEYIKNTRSVLADQITLEEWKNLSNGSIAVLSYTQCIEKKNIPKTLKSIIDNNINTRNILNISREKMYLDVGKIIQSSQIENDEYKKILEDCEQECFINYKENLRKVSFWINNAYIEYLSKKFNVNIIFIKSNGEQYITSKQDCEEILKDKTKATILLHYIDEVHFESIGLVRMGKVQRVFPPNDPSIIKILNNCIGKDKILLEEYITQFLLNDGIQIDFMGMRKLIELIKTLEVKFRNPQESLTSENTEYYKDRIIEEFNKDKKPIEPFREIYGKNFGNVMEYAVNDILDFLKGGARDFDGGIVSGKTIKRFLEVNDEYKALIED